MSAICSLALTTSTVASSVRVPASLCEIGLTSGAAPVSTVNESDPGTVSVMSTAISFWLVAKLDVSPAAAPEAAALAATATAALRATMMASSAASAATFLRLLAGTGAVGVGACATGITVASVVVVETSVVVVEASVVVVEASVAVVKASVVVVETSVVVAEASVVEVPATGVTVASVVMVDVGGSVISVPPLPSLVRLKFAVV
jgi:hypothetical protein